MGSIEKRGSRRFWIERSVFRTFFKKIWKDIGLIFDSIAREGKIGKEKSCTFLFESPRYITRRFYYSFCSPRVFTIAPQSIKFYDKIEIIPRVSFEARTREDGFSYGRLLVSWSLLLSLQRRCYILVVQQWTPAIEQPSEPFGGWNKEPGTRSRAEFTDTNKQRATSGITGNQLVPDSSSENRNPFLRILSKVSSKVRDQNSNGKERKISSISMLFLSWKKSNDEPVKFHQNYIKLRYVVNQSIGSSLGSNEFYRRFMSKILKKKRKYRRFL